MIKSNEVAERKLKEKDEEKTHHSADVSLSSSSFMSVVGKLKGTERYEEISHVKSPHHTAQEIKKKSKKKSIKTSSYSFFFSPPFLLPGHSNFVKKGKKEVRTAHLKTSHFLHRK